jgi:AcrR family transcriptional regulator
MMSELRFAGEGGVLVTFRSVPPSLAEKLTSAVPSFALAFDKVRMQDIAEASGVPRATLYYYFAGKDDVLAFLLHSRLEHLRASTAAALAAPGTSRARLDAMVRAQLSHLASDPAASQLLLLNLGRVGRLGSIAPAIDDAFRSPVRSILADGVAAGEFRAVDIDVAASAVCGAITIVGLRLLISDRVIDVEGTAGELLSIIWSGVLADIEPSVRAHDSGNLLVGPGEHGQIYAVR